MTITYRMAKMTDLIILLELVKEFHQVEHLPFDEQIDSNALKGILIDESLGQEFLVLQI